MQFYSNARKLFHGLIKQTAPEINEASLTRQHHLSETSANNGLGKFQEPHMADCPSGSTGELSNVDPIVHLWILRLLIPLECHRQFI